MNKQYYLTEIGFDTSIESELNLIQIAHGLCSKYDDDRKNLLPIDTLSKALNYFKKYGFEVIEKLNETPDIAFYYGKRLKANIECGYCKNSQKVMYYKVNCYCKRHEILDIKIFDTSKIPITDYKGMNKVYKKAVEYARYYLNHCQY